MSGSSVDIGGQAVGNLIVTSLAPGMWASYERDWRFWCDWCNSIGADSKNKEMALLLYVGHCKEASWSVSRVSRCKAGLVFGFKLRGRQNCKKQVLKGWRLVEDGRRPVSFQILQYLGIV